MSDRNQKRQNSNANSSAVFALGAAVGVAAASFASWWWAEEQETPQQTHMNNNREEKLAKYDKADYDSDAEVNIESFYCPISYTIMTDPVNSPYGHCFERSAIERWLSKKATCPLTQRPLTKSQLTPCYTLKACISEYIEAHPSTPKFNYDDIDKK